MQRATLRAKGLHPDVLVMTATPIPRTLALTTYGDLDVSIMREMPPGRLPIKTIAKPESRREEIYEFVRKQIDAGRQVYVIYPLVEESEKVDLKAATEMADHLAQDVFPAYRVALLHGRLKQDAKERVMGAFARGEFDILVSTTVIEVGVDVANATVMLVEHAERFGLSQLHQLRGRVGRGPHQSYCVLLYQYPLTDQGRARLKALTETNDGFVIAERDLELRGPGDFFGTRQSGMPTLRVGDLRPRSPVDGRRAARSRRGAGRCAAGGDVECVRAHELGAAVRAGGDWVAPAAAAVPASVLAEPLLEPLLADSEPCGSGKLELKLVADHAHHRRYTERPPSRGTRLAGTASDIRQAAGDAVQRARAARSATRACWTAMRGPAPSGSKRSAAGPRT